MAKIKLTDTASDVIIKMGGGNPGALSVCVELMHEGPKIDPDAKALAPVSALLMLDTLEIYESHIYILYNDYCKRSLAHLIALTRAAQLGLIPYKELENASKADYGTYDLDVRGIFEKVKKQLPNFAKGIENLEEEA